MECAVRFAPIEGADIPSLAQIDSLQVVGKCQCGCASVGFRHLKPDNIAKVVADASGETAVGEQVGVLVFARDGCFVGLKAFGYSDQPASLPGASTVRCSSATRP